MNVLLFLFSATTCLFSAINCANEAVQQPANQKQLDWATIRNSFTVPFSRYQSGLLPQKLLIIDLDETLVSAVPLTAPSLFTTTSCNEIEIYLRPYLYEFLAFVKKRFPVIIYSTGTKKYVDFLVDHFDPAREFIVARFSREDCICRDGSFYKQIDFIEPFEKHCLILDDRTDVYSYKERNGWQKNILKMPAWKGEEDDVELLKLMKHLSNWSNSRGGVSRFKLSYKWSWFRRPSNLEKSYYQSPLIFRH